MILPFIYVLASGSRGGSVREAVENAQETNTQIVLVVLGLLGTCIAILGYVIRGNRDAQTAAEQSTQANNAVNNIGPGQHRLYDKITTIEQRIEAIGADVQENREAIRQFQREQGEFRDHGWGNLPPDLGNSVSLTLTIRELQQASKEQLEILKRIEQTSHQH